MKDNLNRKTLFEMKRSQVTRMDLLLERLGDSPDFWDLIAEMAALTDPRTEEFDGKIRDRDQIWADLSAEIAHQSETLDDDIEESNRIESKGGA